MRFSLLTKDILTDKSDVLLIVAAAAKDGMLMSAKLKALDERLDGLLSAAKRNGFCAAAAETLVLTAVRGNYARVVLIGKGKTLADTTTTIADAVATLGNISSLTLWCENDEAAAATTAAISGAYRYRLGAELPLSSLKHLKLAAALSPKSIDAVYGNWRRNANGASFGGTTGQYLHPGVFGAHGTTNGKEISRAECENFGQETFTNLKNGGIFGGCTRQHCAAQNDCFSIQRRARCAGRLGRQGRYF